jgi:VWFA-related protein
MRNTLRRTLRGANRHSAAGGIIFALLLVPWPGAAADDPLTTADVVRLLRAGVGESTVLHELRTRGFVDVLDAGGEAALREAGASDALVLTLERMAPVEVVAPPAPPRAVKRAPTRGREPSFPVRARTVRVPVSVVDKRGQPVLGLGPGDFRVSEEGRRQAVTQFSAERRPIRIALALDVSGSMTNKVRHVEEALRRFVDLLEPKDEILVIAFNDSVRVLQEFTSDRGLLARIFGELDPVGGTRLYDAAAMAIERVAEGPAESKAVVLVTDGLDTASTASFLELRELARRSEVPVFSIALDSGVRPFGLSPGRSPVGIWLPGGRRRGPGGRGWPGGGGRPPGGIDPGGSTVPWGPVGRTGTDGFDAKPLVALADETGGRAEILKAPPRQTHGGGGSGNPLLEAATERIALILRHRYLLGYEPSEGEGGWRRIRVEVDRPSARARARKGYYGGGA